METNLKFYRTKNDVTVKFREYGEITVPKGTKVSNMTACGPDDKYLFVCEYGWIKEKYPNKIDEMRNNWKKFKAEKGESLEELLDRTIEKLEEIMIKYYFFTFI